MLGDRKSLHRSGWWGDGRGTVGGRRRRLRPALMALEDRRLLATFTVTSTADTTTGGKPTDGTLRWAVVQANAATSPSTIDFSLAAGPQTITLLRGALVLRNTADSIEIDGPGASLLTIDGNENGRVFQVDQGVTATLSGLTITGGRLSTALAASGGLSAILAEVGAGLYNDGSVTIDDCTISGNTAAYGGGVGNVGTAALNRCTISGNAGFQGGGVSNPSLNGPASVVLSDCALSGNSSISQSESAPGFGTATFPGQGAVLMNTGTAALTGCTVSGNSVGTGGADLAGSQITGLGGTSLLDNAGTFTMTDSTITGNTAGIAGVENTGTVTVTGCTIRGNTGASGVLVNSGGTSLTVTGSTISDNSGSWGAGLVNLTGNAVVSDCTISGNVSTASEATESANGVSQTLVIGGNGAGVYNAGSLTLSNSTISGNSSIAVSSVPAGGQTSVLGMGDGDGGGVFNSGTATLTDCTISGNVGTASPPATIDGQVIPFQMTGEGGGVFDRGTATIVGCTITNNSSPTGGGLANGKPASGYNSTLTVSDCTIAGNSAQAAGGVYSLATTNLSDCTISGNSASGAGGVGIAYGSTTLTGVIVAGNAGGTAGDLALITVAFGAVSEPSGSVSGSYNLIGTGGSAGLKDGTDHNIVGIADPLLAPLGNYGGTTATMALLPGSPAIGAGTKSGVSADQRGEPLDSPRPDIGAFQSQGFTITLVPGSTPQVTNPSTLFPQPLAVTVTANNPKEPVAGGVVVFSAPGSGATASLSGTAAVIGSNGVAAVDATANSTNGSYTVVATLADTGSVDFKLANQPVPVFSGLAGQSISYGAPSVTFGGTIAYDNQALPADELITVTLDGTSVEAEVGSDGTFSATFETGTLGVSGSPYPVGFAYGGDANYAATSASSTLIVNPAAPTVTLDDAGGTYDGSPFAATAAVAGIGGSPSTSLEGVPLVLTYYHGAFTDTAQLVGLSPIGPAPSQAGTYTVAATFVGSADYEAASAVVSFTISQATPALTWPTPAALTYGAVLGSGQLDASAEVAGSFAYTPGTGALLHAGTTILAVTFTPEDTVDYTDAVAQVSLVVNPGTPQILWPAPAPVTYGATLGPDQLDAAVDVPGRLIYTPSAGLVPGAGTQMLSVTFIPTDLVDDSVTSASVPITVEKARSALTWPSPASIVYGTPLGASQLDASADVAGTFEYTPAANTILGAGDRSLSVTFTPADSADYTGATLEVPLDVQQAAPVITWVIPAPIVYGTPLGAAQLDASSDVAGTFTYSPAPGMVEAAGTRILSATFTPTDHSDYAAASGEVALTVRQATPTIIWAAPRSIPYGTALGASQLDASTSVPGTFFYSPGWGSEPGPGDQILSVTFVPSDSEDEAVATAQTIIIVTPSATSVGLMSSAPTEAPGRPVTFTASVTIGAGPIPARGSVRFLVDGQDVGSPLPIGPDGQASWTTSWASSGGHAVTAVYSGAGGLAGSSSPAIEETVLAPGLYVDGATLEIVGGSRSSHVLIAPRGARLDGRTGLEVAALLDGRMIRKTIDEALAAIDMFGYGTDDVVRIVGPLAIPTDTFRAGGGALLRVRAYDFGDPPARAAIRDEQAILLSRLIRTTDSPGVPPRGHAVSERRRSISFPGLIG